MNSIFTYKSKNYFIESSCEMKNPQTREWIKATIYVSMESGERYCRSTDEFFNLFKVVE